MRDHPTYPDLVIECGAFDDERDLIAAIECFDPFQEHEPNETCGRDLCYCQDRWAWRERHNDLLHADDLCRFAMYWGKGAPHRAGVKGIAWHKFGNFNA